MNSWLPYILTAICSLVVGAAVGVFSNFINGRISRLHQFRKTVYVLISEIEVSTGNEEAWVVLQRSKDMLNKERAAIAEDVHCWRRGTFENACMQYWNHQTIRKLARQVGDEVFDGAIKDMDATLADITENDNERKLAISRLKRLICLARFFP